MAFVGNRMENGKCIKYDVMQRSTTRGVRRCILLCIMHYTLCIQTACFSLREPEPPDAASTFTPPNQPEVLLSNFVTAVTTLNLPNYERCFARDNFTFSPDQQVAAGNLGLFQAWSFQSHELEYVRNLIRVRSQGQPGRLLFTNARTNNISADSVEYVADYDLTLTLTDTLFVPAHFQGNINLSLSRNPFNEWAIGRWRDTKTTAQPSWTELKEKYVAR